MKKLLLTVVVLVALAAVSLLFLPVRALLIAANLPDFPDWPEPQRTLVDADPGEIYFATSSPYDLEVILGDMSLARPTTGLGYLSFPDDAGPDAPVPAMVILPGSGGIRAGREHDYARWFNEQGIAAFVVEYYAPRGFGKDSDYMIRTSAVTEFDLITDAYSALKLLGTSPLVDPERVGVMGFSYGGMATRLAMDERIRQALAPDVPPFSLHIDVYGPCFQDLQSPRLTGAPVLTLRGTEDASNDLAACEKREAELADLGVEVTARIYEGAGHAWENEQPRFFSQDSPYLAGCELVYDERGRALLDGELLTEYPMEASHATKMAARFSSGLKFRDCVGYGYIVGRDEKARNQGYADIQAFVTDVWQLAGI
jgi:dienelactone hydrolase